jgi:hypothetical protein
MADFLNLARRYHDNIREFRKFQEWQAGLNNFFKRQTTTCSVYLILSGGVVTDRITHRENGAVSIKLARLVHIA